MVLVLVLVLVLMAGMAEGGGNTDSDGVGGGRDLVGAGGVELPTGSAKAFGTVAGGRRVGPRLAVSCVAVAVVVGGAAVVIRRVASWRCHARTMMM